MNGNYHVDPDGELKGFSPILVKCDFEENTTEIGSVIEEELNNCDSIGCAKMDIDYGMPMDQINSLIEQSESCEQDIEFTCLGTPLTFESVNHGWWLNKNGNEQSKTLKNA